MAPLLPVAVGLVVGIGAQRWVGLPLSVCVVMLIASGIALTVLLRRRLVWGGLAALVVAGASVGAARYDVHYNRVGPKHLIHHTSTQRKLVKLRGRVISDPVMRQRSAGAFDRWMRTGVRTRFVLEAAQVGGSGKTSDTEGLVAVSVAGRSWVRIGQVVEITGWLYQVGGPGNPGQFDWQRWQRRRGVMVGLSCSDGQMVRVLPDESSGFWLTLRRWIRDRTGQYLLDGIDSEEGECAELLEAMILGQRSRTTRATDEAFARTGTAHLLSVSGIHVGLLALFGWWLVGLLGLRGRYAAMVVLVLVVTYMLVAQPRAPILRAGILAIMACLASMMHRPGNASNWLCAGTIVILSLRPTELFGAGFQLSFAVVIAVVYLTPRVYRVLLSTPEAVEKLMVRPEDEPVWRRFARSTWHKFLLAVGLAVAAWMVGTPLVAYHFNRWSPTGWANTLLVGPLAGLVMLVGFGKTLLAIVLPSSSAVTGPLLDMVTGWLGRSVETLSRVPYCSLYTPSPPVALIVGWYTLLTLWVLRWRCVDGRLLRLGVVALAAFTIAWWFWPSHDSRALRMHALSVGHGSATVVQLPNGKTLLCDAGTLDGFDVASGTVVPALYELGIDRIDVAIVSHPDIDHFSGLLDIVDRVDVGQVLVSPQFERVAQPGQADRYLIDQLARRGIAVTTMQRGDRLSGTKDVAVEAVWPPLPSAGKPLTDNDASLVLRIEYAGWRVLLSGDIDEEAQARLLGRTDLACDVLVLPHHGSVKITTASFIRATGATHLVQSAGRRSLTNPTALAAVARSATTHNTARDGCVTVIIPADRPVRVETFRNHQMR